MGFKTLFPSKASAAPLQPNFEAARQAQHTESTKAHKGSKSDRVFSGIRKALRVHHSASDAQPVTASASPPPQVAQLYRFESPAATKPTERNATASSAPQSAATTAKSASSPAAAAVASAQTEPAVSVSPTPPSTTVDLASPVTVKKSEIGSAIRTSPTSPPTTADSGLSPTSITDTPPSTPDFITSKNSVDTTRRIDSHLEYKSALEGLRSAEKILERRHASINSQDDTETTKQENNKKTALKTIIKKRTRSPKNSAKSSPNNSPAGSPRVAKLPAHLPAPSYQQRRQPETAQDACDALQRHHIIRHLAYTAAGGCEEATAAFEELNAHYALQARHHDADAIPDLILNFDGIHVRASQLRTTERTWLSRVNAVRKLQSLSDRKQLGQEDFEHIADQLFPSDAEHILKPEYFTIFITGLGTEGIITSCEAKSIVSLHPSIEEFEAGARWAGQGKLKHAHNLSTLAIFEIPQGARKSATIGKARNLGQLLHVLIEAAVYDQKFWKGYFFANARSKLSSFYQAHITSQRGDPTPPHLTEYKRPWTFREKRLLERGAMIVKLLESWDKASLTDFGIIRAVRSSFVRIPGQAYWDAEELSTFLYHRVTNSGLEITMIPEILALHHDYDREFSQHSSRKQIQAKLRDEMETFEMEEERRLREIEVSHQSFEEYKKKGMGTWQRLKHSWMVLFGQKEVVEPFDPFAEEG